MVCYQFSKLVVMIIMYLDNRDYKNHDDLIIFTKNNHDISIFNDNCPLLIIHTVHVAAALKLIVVTRIKVSICDNIKVR